MIKTRALLGDDKWPSNISEDYHGGHSRLADRRASVCTNGKLHAVVSVVSRSFPDGFKSHQPEMRLRCFALLLVCQFHHACRSTTHSNPTQYRMIHRLADAWKAWLNIMSSPLTRFSFRAVY